ncbi:MAG: site-specific DNA-methyltransferase [Coriobacteriia bacterium]|nr:site-specific DNA-methyltransferase [Coriobacteriia bacterium]
MSNDDSQNIYETPSTTPSFKTELAAQLSELIPEAIADGKVDIEKLKELLGDDLGDDRERFGLFWPGKKRALRAAQDPTTATLKPDFENSKDWDTTKNVFIEGDNLEVLKIMQRHYHGKIKLIYIDPPYNTGKDFVYPDNYKEGLETYLEWTRQVNEEGKKVSTNSETEGRYHTNWLNMMYPRLKLARNLLSEDGVIFISIDDNEVSNLMKLCDEVFGEGNFVTDFIWNHRKSSQNDTDISLSHNYTLVYAKNRTIFRLNPLGIDADKFSNPDNDPRGPWVSDPFDAPNVRPNLTYPITNPNTEEQHLPPSGRHWRFSLERFASALSDERVVFGRNGKSRPQLKRFLSEAQEKGKNPFTIWDHVDTATNATKGLMKLFGGKKLFDTPKPVGLIKEILTLGSNADSIVLDFFSGSGTTGHAVMEINAEDGGNRHWIQVQLPEPTPEGSAAREDGYETISALARKRLELAADEILKKTSGQLALRESPLDLGFRSFSLSDTSFTKWHVSSDVEPTELEQHILNLRDSAEDHATPDALLTEVLLKQGYSLTEQISDRKVEGLPLKAVGDGLVLAYLDERIKPTLEQLRAVLAEKPARFVILEDAFQGDDELKTNLAQECKSRGVELWTA